MNGNRTLIKIMSSMTVLVLAFLFGKAIPAAHATEYGSWSMGTGMMGGYGMGWFGSIFMIAFWVLLLGGLFFLVKWLIQGSRVRLDDARPGSRALEILKQRYAQGEIDREEFDQKKQDLELA
jgi:putative membrane protein